jgi:HK97 gp10 family phage protein
MSFKAHFDTRALAAQVDALREDVDAATRPAAQAGSQVLYDAVKANVPRSSQGHWFHGTSFKKNGTKYWFNPGTLRKAIYQKYDTESDAQGLALYKITWRETAKIGYAHMVEYGTKRAKPVAFVRRAAIHMPIALNASYNEFMRRLKVFK